MHTTIIDQQLELAFAENYTEYLSRTTRYCNRIISVAPFKFQRGRILNNEGGIGGLVRTGLAFVLEKGDLDSGLSAMGRYLNEEYSYTNNRAKTHHTKVWFMEEVPTLVEESLAAADVAQSQIDVADTKDPLPVGKAGGAALLGAAAPSSSEEVYHSARSLNDVVRTQEELQFLTAFADFSNSIVEACAALEWDVERGRKIYFRLRRRAYRT